MSITPVVKAFLVCDYVIHEQETNKKSCIGIFHQIRGGPFPCRHGQLSIYANITEAEGDYVFELLLVNLKDGNVLGSGSTPKREGASTSAIPSAAEAAPISELTSSENPDSEMSAAESPSASRSACSRSISSPASSTSTDRIGTSHLRPSRSRTRRTSGDVAASAKCRTVTDTAPFLTGAGGAPSLASRCRHTMAPGT